jgi:pimeloyl-ACP methyl ester carboxylesterase
MHGGSGSWTHWIRNVGILSREYTVLVPDIPGYGASGSVGKDVTSAELASAVVAGFHDIGDNSSTHALIGFSFGSVIAGLMAKQCRWQVGRFVLVGPSGLGIPRTPPEKEMIRWRDLATREEALAAHRHNLSSQMIHDVSRIDDLSVLLQEENTRNSRLNSRPIARSTDLLEALGATECALSGIWGEQDATARGGIERRQELLRRFDPECEFVVIPNSGHWVAYEAADAFNAVLLELLASPRKRAVPLDAGAENSQVSG